MGVGDLYFTPDPETQSMVKDINVHESTLLPLVATFIPHLTDRFALLLTEGTGATECTNLPMSYDAVRVHSHQRFIRHELLHELFTK